MSEPTSTDTSSEAVERLADWAERDYSAMREHPHHPWPEDRAAGERVVAATLRTLAAERDAAVARAAELEGKCAALQERVDQLEFDADDAAAESRFHDP